MNTLKQMVKNRGISFSFILASFAFALSTLILYAITGVNEFTQSLSTKVIVLFAVFTVCAALLSVFEVKLGKYALYIIGLWAWLEYIITQVNYLANIFVAIDRSTFSAAFIMTVLFGALAWITALVSAILQKNELGSSNKKIGFKRAEGNGN